MSSVNYITIEKQYFGGTEAQAAGYIDDSGELTQAGITALDNALKKMGIDLERLKSMNMGLYLEIQDFFAARLDHANDSDTDDIDVEDALDYTFENHTAFQVVFSTYQTIHDTFTRLGMSDEIPGQMAIIGNATFRYDMAADVNGNKYEGSITGEPEEDGEVESEEMTQPEPAPELIVAETVMNEIQSNPNAINNYVEYDVNTGNYTVKSTPPTTVPYEVGVLLVQAYESGDPYQVGKAEEFRALLTDGTFKEYANEVLMEMFDPASDTYSPDESEKIGDLSISQLVTVLDEANRDFKNLPESEKNIESLHGLIKAELSDIVEAAGNSEPTFFATTTVDGVTVDTTEEITVTFAAGMDGESEEAVGGFFLGDDGYLYTAGRWVDGEPRLIKTPYYQSTEQPGKFTRDFATHEEAWHAEATTSPTIIANPTIDSLIDDNNDGSVSEDEKLDYAIDLFLKLGFSQEEATELAQELLTGANLEEDPEELMEYLHSKLTEIAFLQSEVVVGISGMTEMQARISLSSEGYSPGEIQRIIIRAQGYGNGTINSDALFQAIYDVTTEDGANDLNDTQAIKILNVIINTYPDSHVADLLGIIQFQDLNASEFVEAIYDANTDRTNNDLFGLIAGALQEQSPNQFNLIIKYLGISEDDFLSGEIPDDQNLGDVPLGSLLKAFETHKSNTGDSEKSDEDLMNEVVVLFQGIADNVNGLHQNDTEDVYNVALSLLSSGYSAEQAEAIINNAFTLAKEDDLSLFTVTHLFQAMYEYESDVIDPNNPPNINGIQRIIDTFTTAYPDTEWTQILESLTPANNAKFLSDMNIYLNNPDNSDKGLADAVNTALNAQINATFQNEDKPHNSRLYVKDLISAGYTLEEALTILENTELRENNEISPDAFFKAIYEFETKDGDLTTAGADRIIAVLNETYPGSGVVSLLNTIEFGDGDQFRLFFEDMYNVFNDSNTNAEDLDGNASTSLLEAAMYALEDTFPNQYEILLATLERLGFIEINGEIITAPNDGFINGLKSDAFANLFLKAWQTYKDNDDDSDYEGAVEEAVGLAAVEESTNEE